MKSTTQLTTHQSTKVESIVQTLQNELDSAHKVYLKEVIHDASTLAHSNLPEAENESGSCEHHFANMRGFYTRLSNGIPLRLGGALQLMLGSFDMANINEKIGKLTHKRDLEERDFNHLKSDLERTDNADLPKEHLLFLRIVWLLLFGDILSMISAFLALGESFFVSIVLGTLFGAGIFLSIKAFVLVYRDKDIHNRWIKYVLPWILLFVAVIIGLMRGLGSNEHSITASLVFICINLVLFIANAVVIYQFYPSHSQLKQIEYTDSLKKAVQEKKDIITQLDQEIEQLNVQKNHTARYRVQIRHAQKLLFERVQSMFIEAIGVFIQTNQRHRKDLKYPACFKVPIAPLEVSNDDETINHFNNNDHEQ